MTLRLVSSGGRPDILVDRLPVMVGRHPQCDSRLASLRVSRWHCCLTEIDGALWVRDLGSTNGIWINGRRVITGRMQLGQRVNSAVSWEIARHRAGGRGETGRRFALSASSRLIIGSCRRSPRRLIRARAC